MEKVSSRLQRVANVLLDSFFRLCSATVQKKEETFLQSHAFVVVPRSSMQFMATQNINNHT